MIRNLLESFLRGERFKFQILHRSKDKEKLAEKILQKVSPILYPMKGERKGIIVTLISEWSPVMGYVVIAENLNEGRDLQKQLFGLFGK